MIDKIFLNQKVWLFFSVCLIFSFITLQLGGDLNPFVYLKWILYFTLPSIPIFIWIYFRDLYKGDISKVVNFLSSMIAFIFYPLLLTTTLFGTSVLKVFGNILFGYNYLTDPYISLVLAYILLEICLRINSKNSNQKVYSWLKRMSPFMWCSIVVVCFTFLFLIMNNYFMNSIKFESVFFKLCYFSFCAAQLFVIYMSYYFYYEWHYKVLFEKLLKIKGIIYYSMGVVFTLLIFVPIHNFIISFFPVVSALKLHSVGLVPNIMDDFNFGITTFVLTISFPFILLQEWYKKSSAIKELEKQKTSIELNLLKEQINPHFFFNTLNNLYAMSLTNDAETPEVILKLSELMRYVIYKGKEDRVRLTDEIYYIRDYIDLQAIRLRNKLDFSHDITIEDKNWEISPLLLIIFVENAFKHGGELEDRGTVLYFNIVQKNDSLEFTCVNSIDVDDAVTESGIGLQNLKKRLDILYNGNYTVNTSIENGFFKAYLKVGNENS